MPGVNISVDGKGNFTTCLIRVFKEFVRKHLSVLFPGGVVLLKAGTTVNAVASIVNPLNKPMTDVVFFVEGAGLLSPQTIPAK